MFQFNIAFLLFPVFLFTRLDNENMKILAHLAFLVFFQNFFWLSGFRLNFCLLVCHAMLVLHRKWYKMSIWPTWQRPYNPNIGADTRRDSHSGLQRCQTPQSFVSISSEFTGKLAPLFRDSSSTLVVFWPSVFLQFFLCACRRCNRSILNDLSQCDPLLWAYKSSVDTGCFQAGLWIDEPLRRTLMSRKVRTTSCSGELEMTWMDPGHNLSWTNHQSLIIWHSWWFHRHISPAGMK